MSPLSLLIIFLACWSTLDGSPLLADWVITDRPVRSALPPTPSVLLPLFDGRGELPPPRDGPPLRRTTSTLPRSVQRQTQGAYYPTRGGWWTGCGSWHHLTLGRHRGKFDHQYLRSLSWSELQSLHSDDHEGRVKWQYVVRPFRSSMRTTPTRSLSSHSRTAPRSRIPSKKWCPPGST